MTSMKKMVLMERDKPFTKIVDGPHGFDSFEEAVEAIRKAEGCSGTEAMTRAHDRFPALLEKYEAEGREAAAKARAVADAELAKRDSKAIQRFDLLVEGIMAREQVSRLRAMQIARKEHPAAFEAYQAA